jgi:uncharacterized protein
LAPDILDHRRWRIVPMMLDALDRPAGETQRANRLAIIDGDIHTTPNSLADLAPFLETRWVRHLETYGSRKRHGANFEPYPKSAPRATRRDAWPDSGATPGSDLALLQSQHLDFYGVDIGIMGPLSFSGQGEINPDLSAAMARAINDWQIHVMARPEPRLKASVVVPFEEASASVKEIERIGADPSIAQAFMLTRSQDPLGNRRYWPIYEAAAAHDLPVAMHVFGAGGHAYTGAGWPSYYIEEGSGHSTSCQTVVTSLVMEGVFERIPKLKVVIVEGGFGWLPALTWRLDKLFETMRDEVPHLKRRPSDYIREHIWLTTQPMEEPADRQHLADVVSWVGADRLLFASDYPHWDFDDPFRAFPASIGEADKTRMLTENGKAVYRLM